jgi:hypothetical protein
MNFSLAALFYLLLSNFSQSIAVGATLFLLSSYLKCCYCLFSSSKRSLLVFLQAYLFLLMNSEYLYSIWLSLHDDASLKFYFMLSFMSYKNYFYHPGLKFVISWTTLSGTQAMFRRTLTKSDCSHFLLISFSNIFPSLSSLPWIPSLMSFSLSVMNAPV